MAENADDAVPAQATDRPPLSDVASHYITDAHGRVIGIDGSAGALSEAQSQQVTVARALPVTQTAGVAPEVRVAYPVTARKATPVDDGVVAAPTAFNVQAELSREDERPVIPAQRVVRAARPTMFGASDNVQSFGRD